MANKKRKKGSNRAEQKFSSQNKKTENSVFSFAKKHPGRILLIAICVATAIILLCSAFIGKKDDIEMAETDEFSVGNSITIPETKIQTEDPRPEIPDFVDLTEISDTMVIAQVYDMIQYPDDYMGKTIKIGGLYYTEYNENTEKRKHYLIYDGCCQTMEFIWNGEHDYPKDYPEDYKYIEVSGVFGVYEESGWIHCYLSFEDAAISMR
ncbi:MAG: hypothetical protein FWG34_13050 [Oscillospiraceae bacterium]|nr:hypothetical protein [Oscillospiraceae bacterium]